MMKKVLNLMMGVAVAVLGASVARAEAVPSVEPAGAELNICCQGAGTGALVATGRAGDAGIGGGYAAGLGGGSGGSGGTVLISGGSVQAGGGYAAAGIGDGAGGNGNDVVIRRGTLVATAGTGAQSIGTGEDGVSSGGLEHFGLGVFAGDDSRSATWFDDVDVARKNPFEALLQVVSVTLTAEACDKIANVGSNIAVKLKSAGVEIPLELQGGSYVGYAAVGTDLQLLLVPPQGYGFGSHDGAIPLGTVGESDIRVTLQGVSLPTLIELSPVSYWVIEGETAVERTRNSYVEVSAATARLEDGQWYVVTGEVTIDRRLPVHGHAHLILCDGAVLTVNGGIEVDRQNDVSDALDIHGSANGTGRLVAIATGERTAGIGGSHEAVVVQGLSGGVVTVCRAEVVAVGGRNGGAGIGGAWGGDGGEVYVCDATVTATGGDYQGRDGERLHGAGIGAGARDFAGEGDSGWLWMLGGETVVWSGESAETAKADVFCTMRNKYCRIEPGRAVSLPATFEAMTYAVSADGSAPLTGRTVDGRTYFVLPRNCAALTVTFAAKPGCEIWRGDSTVTLTDFSATVSEFPADRLPSAAEPVPYVVRNGATTNDLTRLDYVPVTSATTGLTNGQWGVVRGEVTLEERLHITGSATILLADDAKLMAPAGIEVNVRDALTIYGQAEGTGALEARGRYGEAGIGGGYENGSSGTVTVHGGVIMAVGGSNGAGIGGGWHYKGGTVLVYGGVVTATGGELCAGIGGSERNDGGTVTISGGTVVATGNRGEDIGGGAWGTYGDSVLTISGGSVKAKLRDGLVKNPANDRLSCVTVKCEGLDGLVNLEGLEGYGTNDIFAIDGCVYLWLPDGTHSFALSNGAKTLHYFAAVNGRDITVEPHPEIGFFVNGEEIVNGKGLGWTYDGQCLRFEAEDFYVLSGCSTNNEVRIVVEQLSVTLSLLNAVVLAKDHSALELKSGADVTLLMAGGTSILAATNGASAVTVEADAKLTVGLAPEADRLESALCVFNSCVEVPAVGGAGEAVVAGGTFLAWGDGQAVGLPTFNVGEDEVMKVGEDPDTARFAVTCGNASCVLVAPAVTVTVRDDIPHVSGFMVSNAVEAVAGQSVSGGTAYRVMLSDDMSVGYMLEAGFVSDAENPFTYASIEHDVTIDASMIAVGVLVAPGVPVVFNSAAEASNVVARAELTPSAEVAAVFGGDANAKAAYCAKFGFAVVPTSDDKWAVVAGLKLAAWSNLVESAQAATRQLPVAKLASHEYGVPLTDVPLTNCVPGFYYSLYSGTAITNINVNAEESNRNILCGPNTCITIPVFPQSSPSSGFFAIGVGATRIASDAVRNVAREVGGGLYLGDDDIELDQGFVVIKGTDVRFVGNTVGNVVLTAPKDGTSGFYRIIVRE